MRGGKNSGRKETSTLLSGLTARPNEVANIFLTTGSGRASRRNRLRGGGIRSRDLVSPWAKPSKSSGQTDKRKGGRRGWEHLVEHLKVGREGKDR